MYLSGTTDVTPIIGVFPRASKRASAAVQFLTFEGQKLLSRIGNKSSIHAPQKPYTLTEALICAPNSKCRRACLPLRISSRPTYVLLSLRATLIAPPQSQRAHHVHATQGFHPRGLIGFTIPLPFHWGTRQPRTQHFLAWPSVRCASSAAELPRAGVSSLSPRSSDPAMARFFFRQLSSGRLSGPRGPILLTARRSIRAEDKGARKKAKPNEKKKQQVA